MPLQDDEIDRIVQIVTERPYWGGGNHVFRALGIGDNWNIGKNLNIVRLTNDSFRDHLRELGDGETEALLTYFELRTHDHSDAIWPVKGLKLFVSYHDDQYTNLSMLGGELTKCGISAFLAHDANVPGRDWREKQIAGLCSMDALLAYCSAGFAASNRTDHEVGFAYEKKVPVVPVLAGELPQGLLEPSKGILGAAQSEETARQLAESIFKELAAEEATKDALSIGLASQLKFAPSFQAVESITSRMVLVGYVATAAIRDVQLALAANDQIGESKEQLGSLLGRGRRDDS